MERIREEVLNVLLAQLLDERDFISIPESVKALNVSRQKRLPDVTIADLWGVRILIEGKIDSHRTTKEKLEGQAKRRIEEGLCPISLAVLYPEQLAHIELIAGAKRALARVSLEVCVYSESDDGTWGPTTVDGLGEILRRSYELLVNEDVVIRAVAEFEASIESASHILAASKATPARIRTLLGIPEETGTENPEEEESD